MFLSVHVSYSLRLKKPNLSQREHMLTSVYFFFFERERPLVSFKHCATA